jgi:hypothetical protein
MRQAAIDSADAVLRVGYWASVSTAARCFARGAEMELIVALRPFVLGRVLWHADEARG